MVERRRGMLMVLSTIPGHTPGMVTQDQVHLTPKACPGGKVSSAHLGSRSFRLHTKLTDRFTPRLTWYLAMLHSFHHCTLRNVKHHTVRNNPTQQPNSPHHNGVIIPCQRVGGTFKPFFSVLHLYTAFISSLLGLNLI